MVRAANMELDLAYMRFNVLRTLIKEAEQGFNNHREMIVCQINVAVQKEIKSDAGLREAINVLYRNAGPDDLELKMKIVAKAAGRLAAH